MTRVCLLSGVSVSGSTTSTRPMAAALLPLPSDASMSWIPIRTRRTTSRRASSPVSRIRSSPTSGCSATWTCSRSKVAQRRWRTRAASVPFSRCSSRSNTRLLMKRITSLALATLLAAAPAAAQVTLNGAGATFPNIIYSNWMLTYNQAHPDVKLNYQSIGSGGGIRQFSDGTVDFGGTDAPMTDSAIAAIQGNVLHIPTVLGAIVAIYNLPGVTQQLKFTPDVLADIFLGKITKWNDARIASVNQGVPLPATDIVVVHRADGSGTTYGWTDYLTKVSPEWASQVGKGASVNWPVGLGGRGNEGVSATVNQTPGAIG